ncbi:MAG: ferredoxin, partial [bacterium]|nr:ferredoxin [bacterium]
FATLLRGMPNQQEYLRTREDSKIGKIVVDRDLCIGAASCIAVAENTYKLDNENKAVVIGPNAVDDDTLLMSAQSCPVRAILLFDKDGKQIFPE